MNDNYIFDLEFKDGLNKNIDLPESIKDKVAVEESKTDNIDKDWRCLEFNSGIVDIESKTLYDFTKRKKQIIKSLILCFSIFTI